MKKRHLLISIFFISFFLSYNPFLEARNPVKFEEVNGNRAYKVTCEFEKKKEDPSYQLNSFAQTVMDFAKRITIFENVSNEEEIILNHPEEYSFLTTKPHYLHKHILVSLLRHNNDIRLRYDAAADELKFHTGDKVKDVLAKSKENYKLLFDIDYFGFRVTIGEEPPTELHASFQREGDGCYYVEIVTGSKYNLPTSAGNHTFLRLIDSEGKVYSAGKHPATSITSKNSYAKQPQVFFSTDFYEWLTNRNMYAHRFPLTYLEFEELKDSIEEDLRNNFDPQKTQDYGVFGGDNCSDWVVDKVAKFIPIDKEEIKVDIISALIPTIYEYLNKNTPSFVKTVFYPVKKLFSYYAHFPRLIMVLASGGLETNPSNENSESFLQLTKEFLLDNRVHMTIHPFYLHEYLEKHKEELLEERIQQMDSKDLSNYYPIYTTSGYVI
jgi:hypothetical protein